MSSICVTESLQSRRMLDDLHKQQDAHAAQREAELETAHLFSHAIAAGDPDATPEWCGTVPDYAAGRKLGMAYGAPGFPHRRSTVAECLQSGLDYPSGPGMEDVLRVLSLAMKSSDAAVAVAARALVGRAAEKFAEHNTPEVDA